MQSDLDSKLPLGRTLSVDFTQKTTRKETETGEDEATAMELK